MKHTLRLCLCWVLMLLFLLPLSGCFLKKTTPEEILARYDNYPPLAEGENRAGIYVGEIEHNFEKTTISIRSTSKILKQSQENAEATAARLQVFNAADPTRALDVKIAVIHAQGTRDGAIVAEEFYPAVIFGKDVKAEYALIYFSGVSGVDVESIETPALFFLVRLDKGATTVLTETPRLAGAFLEDLLATSTPQY